MPFKPERLLILLGSILLIFPSFTAHVVLSFNIYDMHISISNIQFTRSLSIILFLYAFIYWRFDNYFYTSKLTYIHIFFSVLLPLIALYLSYNFAKSLTLIELTESGVKSYFDTQKRLMNLILLGFIVVQFLPILNLLIGGLKKCS